MSQTLNHSLEALMKNIDLYANSKTVIGEPVIFGKVVIVPLIDVSFGVGAGETGRGAASGGMGAKITPQACLVVMNNTVQLVNVKNQDSLNKLIDLVPGVLAKISSMFEQNPDKTEPRVDLYEEL